MTTLLKVGILTASDRSHRGEREDKSGYLLKLLVEDIPAEVIAYHILPDEKNAIQKMLIHMADILHCDLILTTGGTGLAPRDVTPEATRGILDREIPGIAEAIRAAGMRHKATAMLSRGLSGIRGKTLIINLPGSPYAAEESFQILRPILGHAIELLRGEVSDCQKLSLLSHSHS